MKIGIIGSGPAGIAFYKKIVDSRIVDPDSVSVFDPSGKLCSQQAEHNLYVENLKSKCPEQLKFLIDGTKSGPQLQKYFQDDILKRYSLFGIRSNPITKIERIEEGGFRLFNEDNLVEVVDEVVLATGVRQKLLPETVFDDRRESYDYTFKKFLEFQKIDFLLNEVIFIGSGDNVLFKAHRLARWILDENIPYLPSCIKIFVKGNFKNDCNPHFIGEVMEFVDAGLIEIKNSLWEVESISGDFVKGGVRKIRCVNEIYISNFEKGAYLSIHTGNTPNIPHLINCSLENLIPIGDLSLFVKGKICSIYNAIMDAENMAEELIKLEEIKMAVMGNYPIDKILFIRKFEMSFSKFTTQDHHFLVKTDQGILFLKKYNRSHKEKIKKEIEAIEKLRKMISIPSIFPTNSGDLFLENNGVIFVLYDYIDASNLKDIGVDDKSFFDILCEIESKLIRSIPSNEFYDFKEHFDRFELESSLLIDVIKKDDRPHSLRDVRYVNFLIDEMKSIKGTLIGLEIPKNLIHGDFLPQNLLKDKTGTIWVVDWEKSFDYMTSVDVMRSVTFTLFDTRKKDFGLSVNEFGKWAKYCIDAIPMSATEKLYVMDIYYLHLVSNIDFLKRLYTERQNLNEKMAGEDYEVCKWFKKNKEEINLIIAGK